MSEAEGANEMKLDEQQRQKLARWAGNKRDHLDLIAFVEAVLSTSGLYTAQQVERAIMNNSENWPGFDASRQRFASNVLERLSERDTMKAEYDFSEAEVGKYIGKIGKQVVTPSSGEPAPVPEECPHFHPLRQALAGGGFEYHCADCGVLIEPRTKSEPAPSMQAWMGEDQGKHWADAQPAPHASLEGDGWKLIYDCHEKRIEDGVEYMTYQYKRAREIAPGLRAKTGGGK